MSDKCPDCGALVHPNIEGHYLCGSRADGQRQSTICMERKGSPPSTLVVPPIGKLQARIDELDDLAEAAWGLIANAYGGDWDLASEASGWKAAAERWRDRHNALRPLPTGNVEDAIDEEDHTPYEPHNGWDRFGE